MSPNAQQQATSGMRAKQLRHHAVNRFGLRCPKRFRPSRLFASGASNSGPCVTHSFPSIEICTFGLLIAAQWIDTEALLSAYVDHDTRGTPRRRFPAWTMGESAIPFVTILYLTRRQLVGCYLEIFFQGVLMAQVCVRPSPPFTAY